MDFDVKEYVLSNPAPEVFKKLHNDRNTVMTRAVDSAKLTLPYMATEDSHTESDTLDTPFQAIGSRVVNSLASKLMLSLFPPNLSFFVRSTLTVPKVSVILSLIFFPVSIDE